MSYTQVFGGTTIYPSDVSLLAITLNADKALEWPLESNDPSNPAARIIDVTTTGSYAITLPDATQTGAGQTILFNNLSASSNSFLLKDAGGGTIATVGVGEQWQVYLSGTATVAGTWRVFRYGASTATVQASALAGYGLTVTSNTLSQSLPVTTFNSGPRTVLLTDRASALVWNGTGAGVLNLPTAASAGNNFFIGVRNSGGGDLTVDASGSELLDGLPSLALRPGDSANVITDGIQWYTLGLGQEAVFAFDYTSIAVSGGTYTLAGSELNRIVYKFVGTLTADQYIVVPSTVQQYWVDNATTGAFSFYLRTSGGTPISVAQGGRGIYYCNGSNVIDADTSTVSLPISATDGGTGITSYTVGDLLYANSATSLARLADVAVGNALISGGVGVVPSWGKIGLTTHVSGTLPVANGGTGATTSTGTGAVVLATSPTLVTPNIGTPSAATLTNATGLPIVAGTTGTLSVARGGTGATTSTGSGAVVLATSPTISGNLAVSGPATFGDTVGIGAGSTGAVSIELGSLRVADGVSFLDLSVRVGADFDTRFVRNTGVNGALQIINAGTGPVTFEQNAAESARFSSAGNFGIGTPTPAERLSVVGNITATGGLTLGTALPVASGGTGVASLTAGYLVKGNGTSAASASVVYDDGTNVGINTTTPSSKFAVFGGASGTDTRITVGNAASAFQLGVGSANETLLVGNAAVPMAFYTNSVERMRIDSAGNVGIGTPTPGGLLQLNKPTGAADLRLSVGGTLYGNIYASASDLDIFAVTAIPIIFGTNNTERMRIDSAGNVAIGTPSAGARLEVAVSAASGERGIIARNTSTAQFAGAAIALVGPSTTSTRLTHYNANTGGSQGTFSIQKGDSAGGFSASIAEYAYATDNWTFNTAGATRLTINSTGGITSSDLADAVGYKGMPQNSQTASYTLALSDMGKHISITTGGVVIPANSGTAFPIGSTIVVYNDSGSAQNISITTDTLRLAGTATTGTRSLAQRGLATCVKVKATEWVVSGNVA